MSDEILTYPKLKRELLKKVVPYTLTRAQGAFLVFLWALGAGSLLVVFNMPLLALILTGALLGLGGLLARTYLRDRETRSRIIRSIIEEQIRTDELDERTLQAAVGKGIEVFTEIAAKIFAITEEHGPTDDLHQVLADAHGMLSLQFESAKRVEEYKRILALINPRSGLGRLRGRPEAKSEAEPATLREENIAVIERSTAEEQTLVGEIGERLETVMLQVLQMERGTTDLVRTAQFAEEAGGSLRSFQAVVDARRDTVDVIRRMAPARM